MIVAASISCTGLVALPQAASAAPATVPGCGTFDFEPVIYLEYVGQGGAGSGLGCPVGNSKTTGNGRARYHDFQNGSIYWNRLVANSQPATVMNPIRDKWANLNWENGFLGLPVNDTFPVYGSNGLLGAFNVFEGGAIFTSALGTYEVHGQILSKMWEVGVQTIGLPMSDEQDFSNDGGKVTEFQQGQIYWWADTGPISIKGRIRVSYAGLHMHERTDDNFGGSKDEPYAILSAVWPGTANNKKTYNTPEYSLGDSNTDCEENNAELYVGRPNGIELVSTVMEHDYGDKDAARRKADEYAKKAADWVIGQVQAMGPIGLGIAKFGGPILRDAFREIGALLGGWFGDELVGTRNKLLTPKDMVKLAVAPRSVYDCIGYKVASDQLEGYGGKYQTYFNITVVP
jgi:hypothetical protein